MTDHGHRRDGTPITDADVDAMVDEAEAGYDVEAVLARRRGRPTLGSAPAGVESVRLDPEPRAALLTRAADDGISVSETIRRALRAYTHAKAS